MENYLFLAFVVTQIGFSKLESFCEKRWAKSVARKHWIIWCIHPTVVRGGHDFVIYVVSELPKHL